ncbi:MAG: hypothetical protein ABJA98_35935 [Acidobacteriota bacterium]
MSLSLLAVLLIVTQAVGLHALGAAQQRGAAASATARSAAPIDLTGYWVSVVTQDWRWRMVTPARGDYESVPITLEAKKVGDAWDPAKDEAAGEQCRAYGAPAIMAVPTRLRVTWQDDRTLKVETDAGMQTRLLHFDGWKPQGGPAGWQGESVAEWERARGGRGSASGEVLRGATGGPQSGSLKVVTKNARPGYLRKNGVPYSAGASLTEYWDVGAERNGDRWITITSVVDDPKYLRVAYVTALQFKHEADGAKWEPTPCSAR